MRVTVYINGTIGDGSAFTLDVRDARLFDSTAQWLHGVETASGPEVFVPLSAILMVALEGTGRTTILQRFGSA